MCKNRAMLVVLIAQLIACRVVSGDYLATDSMESEFALSRLSLPDTVPDVGDFGHHSTSHKSKNRPNSKLKPVSIPKDDSNSKLRNLEDESSVHVKQSKEPSDQVKKTPTVEGVKKPLSGRFNSSPDSLTGIQKKHAVTKEVRSLVNSKSIELEYQGDFDFNVDFSSNEELEYQGAYSDIDDTGDFIDFFDLGKEYNHLLKGSKYTDDDIVTRYPGYIHESEDLLEGASFENKDVGGIQALSFFQMGITQSLEYQGDDDGTDLSTLFISDDELELLDQEPEEMEYQGPAPLPQLSALKKSNRLKRSRSLTESSSKKDRRRRQHRRRGHQKRRQ